MGGLAKVSASESAAFGADMNDTFCCAFVVTEIEAGLVLAALSAGAEVWLVFAGAAVVCAGLAAVLETVCVAAGTCDVCPACGAWPPPEPYTTVNDEAVGSLGVLFCAVSAPAPPAHSNVINR